MRAKKEAIDVRYERNSTGHFDATFTMKVGADVNTSISADFIFAYEEGEYTVEELYYSVI